MKPIIGITCPWSEETWGPTTAGGGYDYVGRAYVSAIYRAGAIPILISPIFEDNDIDRIIDMVDGLYFTGGGNGRIHTPGKLPTLLEQQPVRSKWESELIKIAYGKNMPMLGVCRGHQMISVILGGAMDTVRMLEHKQDVPPDIGIHDVEIQQGTLLEKLIGKESWHVNSIHVERVKDLPPEFTVCATAEDGSIEAICALNKDFVLSTQFHPELMPQDIRSQKIFSGFVKAAGNYREAKK